MGIEHLDISLMTEQEINAELEKGHADMIAGRVYPLEEVFAELKKEIAAKNKTKS
jgi:predicted transcriptional regulator